MTGRATLRQLKVDSINTADWLLHSLKPIIYSDAILVPSTHRVVTNLLLLGFDAFSV